MNAVMSAEAKLSNGQLCELLVEKARGLGRLFKGRRNRDRAIQEVTGCELIIMELASRVAKEEAWEMRPARAWDDESAGRAVPYGREAWDDAHGDPMLSPDDELPPGRDEDWAGVGFDAEDDLRPISMGELLHGNVTEDEMEAADGEGITVTMLRLRHYGELMRYLVRGCRERDEVSDRVLAIGRRSIPEEMRRFVPDGNVSQAAVSRKIRPGGETRAATQAREKREVERPLREAGALGYRGAGGTKGEAHRERCRQAQLESQGKRGSNRRRGHLERKGEEPLGAETMGDADAVEGVVIGDL